jgi:hypothetical protein
VLADVLLDIVDALAIVLRALCVSYHT